MAGSFTHLKTDPSAYHEAVQRSTQPFNYRLDPNYVMNCQAYGQNLQAGSQTDVDTILKGINKKNSKNNHQQMPIPLKNYNPSLYPTNSNTLESQSTRYTHPAFDIRGLTTSDMRFDYPLVDPQCQIFENFQVNTRLQAKDNHRATWPDRMDQTHLLPRDRLSKIQNRRHMPELNTKYAPYR